MSDLWSRARRDGRGALVTAAGRRVDSRWLAMGTRPTR
jgi:hypothetical protein